MEFLCNSFLSIMVMWVVEFSREEHKIKNIFCQKSNVLERKYCILLIDVVGRWQKEPKLDFQSQFSLSKIIRIFRKNLANNMNLGAPFLLLTLSDNFNFWSTLFSKMMLNFWRLATMSIQKITISCEYIDFWAKIYLISYPSHGNSTTHITIINHAWVQWKNITSLSSSNKWNNYS